MGAEQERWPIGDYHGCFECGEIVHTDDVTFEERSLGSFFILCPGCSPDTETDTAENEVDD